MSYDRVTIFLRAPLFTLPGDAAHVPSNAVIIEGSLEDEKGGPVVKTRKFSDERGRMLSEAQITLLIPWSKIDHLRIDG